MAPTHMRGIHLQLDARSVPDPSTSALRAALSTRGTPAIAPHRPLDPAAVYTLPPVDDAVFSPIPLRRPRSNPKSRWAAGARSATSPARSPGLLRIRQST